MSSSASNDPQQELECLEQLITLLEWLQSTKHILELNIETQAQLVPVELMITKISFVVAGGLTISKYHNIKNWIENNFPVVSSVRRVYHQHTIVIYYEYEAN